MSYTKGPWKSPWDKFEPDSFEVHNRFTGPNGEEVVGVGYYDGEILKVSKDDASLIAAAPEMLEMLKECRDYLVESLNNVMDDGRPRYERQRQLIRDDMAKLDALIARAEGTETCPK